MLSTPPNYNICTKNRIRYDFHTPTTCQNFNFNSCHQFNSSSNRTTTEKSHHISQLPSQFIYCVVTLFARFLGWSTSNPRRTVRWQASNCKRKEEMRLKLNMLMSNHHYDQHSLVLSERRCQLEKLSTIPRNIKLSVFRSCN